MALFLETVLFWGCSWHVSAATAVPAWVFLRVFDQCYDEAHLIKEHNAAASSKIREEMHTQSGGKQPGIVGVAPSRV